MSGHVSVHTHKLQAATTGRSAVVAYYVKVLPSLSGSFLPLGWEFDFTQVIDNTNGFVFWGIPGTAASSNCLSIRVLSEF